MAEQPASPIAGYTPQDAAAIDLVNNNKVAEECVLRILDDLGRDARVDRQWLDLGRMQIQQGFMAINRAVFRPTRIKIPGE